MSIKRKAIKDLATWLSSKHRKPLVLRGARQVGKSTLVKDFALEAKLNLIEINLEERSLQTFSSKTIDIHKIILEIELIIERRINPEKDLVFIDEIQKSTTALMSLRYFYEKRPDLKVIAAGSLLDFVLNDEQFSFPVGRVEFYKVGPLLFSEFLEATKNEILIEEFQKPLAKISDIVHQKLIELWKIYSMIGGMPEVVSLYFENKKDFNLARKTQKNILFTYKADIMKYSKQSQIVRCDKVFDWIPGSLGEKVKYSEIDRNEKARDLKIAIDTLSYARVITKCFHCNAMKLPLAMSKDESVYKLYHLDSGLAAAMMDLDVKSYLLNEDSYNGKLAEQVVAQNLISLNPYDQSELFYWLKDKSSHNAEVDFVISSDGNILPIEVKSGPNSRSKSLFVFKEDHPKVKSGIIFSTEPFKISRNTEHKFQKIHCPLYGLEKIIKLP